MRFYLSCLFAIFSSCLFSQKSITGITTDSLKNETIPFASVGLLSLPDSTIIKGTITDESGTFKLDDLMNGSYALKISAVGYLDKLIGNIHVDSSSQKLNFQIVLNTSSHTFNEVAITAIRRTVEFKNNNVIVNVEDSPLAQGNSVYDLLSKIPGVTIENDEIKIQGKAGVVIMIDDRPQNLASQQLLNMLRGMPADAVKKIELLKNPAVKYDASGTSGMINIVTKKTTVQGFTGSVFGSYSQGFYGQSMAGGSLNYKSKRMTLYSNLSGNYNEYINFETFRKRFVQDTAFSFLDGKSVLRPFFKGFNGKIGADFNLTPVSVLGVKIDSEPGVYTFQSNGKNYVTDDPDANFSYLGASNYMYDDWAQTDFNLDFNHKVDTLGSDFSFIADYTILPEYVASNTYNGYYDNSGNEILKPDNYKNTDRSSSNLIAVRSNLKKVIDTSSSFETGIKFSHIKTSNDFVFKRDLLNNNVFIEDTSLSNKYNYRELTYAGYFNYIKSIGKWNMELGLRIENTYLKGSSDKQFALQKKYLNVFPNLSFDYKKNENHDFQFNLSRRINRPGFFILNPVRQYRDQYYYQQGNPGLVPDYANKAELSYNYKGEFSTSVSYSYTENIMLGYTSQIDSLKLTIESEKNMDYSSSFEYSLFYQKSVIKNWEISVNGSVQYSKFKGDIAGATFLTKGFGSFVNLNNTFLLGKKIKLETGGRFIGPNVYGILTRKIYWGVNVALKMTLLKEKLDLTIGADDVFRSQKWRTAANFETQYWSYSRREDTWRARIALNYKFGKIKIEERKSDDDTDKERLGH